MVVMCRAIIGDWRWACVPCRGRGGGEVWQSWELLCSARVHVEGRPRRSSWVAGRAVCRGRRERTCGARTRRQAELSRGPAKPVASYEGRWRGPSATAGWIVPAHQVKRLQVSRLQRGKASCARLGIRYGCIGPAHQTRLKDEEGPARRGWRH